MRDGELIEVGNWTWTSYRDRQQRDVTQVCAIGKLVGERDLSCLAGLWLIDESAIAVPQECSGNRQVLRLDGSPGIAVNENGGQRISFDVCVVE